jgi:hypothetical protein
VDPLVGLAKCLYMTYMYITSVYLERGRPVCIYALPPYARHIQGCATAPQAARCRASCIVHGDGA